MNTATDRTSEFISVVNILKQKHAADPQIRTQKSLAQHGKPGGGVAVIRQRQEFNATAKKIGQNLSRTFEKLEKLTLLCKQRNLFDDRPIEISDLTSIINQDIDGLKRSLVNLESVARGIPNNGRKDIAKQTKTQIKELSSRVTTASKSFLNVIELRKENIKFQNERKLHFQQSESVSGGQDGIRNRKNQTGQAFAAFEQHNSNSVLLQDEYESKQKSVPMDAFRGADYQDMQMMQQEDNYAQEREKNMETIESAIVEVGNVIGTRVFGDFWPDVWTDFGTILGIFVHANVETPKTTPPFPCANWVTW